MAHFAEINSDNNKVLRVIVIGEQQAIDHGGENSIELEQWVKDNHPKDPFIDYSNISDTYWKRTSYNTRENKHLNGGTPFRGNYAGVGFTYDPINDIFYSPQPYNSWTLNLTTASYEAPVAYPSIITYGDGAYYRITWDEDNLRWLGYDNSDPSNEFAWDPDLSSWIATGN
jgi:hypothetical protein